MQGNIEIQPNTESGRIDWDVIVQDTDKVLGTYENKIDAIEWGITYARDARTELFIKDADGQIEDRRSYGNDPPPPESPDEGWEPKREPLVPEQDPETGAPIAPDGEPVTPEEEVPPPVPPTPDPDPSNVTPAVDDEPASHESPLTEKPE